MQHCVLNCSTQLIMLNVYIRNANFAHFNFQLSNDVHRERQNLQMTTEDVGKSEW